MIWSKYSLSAIGCLYILVFNIGWCFILIWGVYSDLGIYNGQEFILLWDYTMGWEYTLYLAAYSGMEVYYRLGWDYILGKAV